MYKEEYLVNLISFFYVLVLKQVMSILKLEIVCA